MYNIRNGIPLPFKKDGPQLLSIRCQGKSTKCKHILQFYKHSQKPTTNDILNGVADRRVCVSEWWGEARRVTECETDFGSDGSTKGRNVDRAMYTEMTSVLLLLPEASPKRWTPCLWHTHTHIHGEGDHHLMVGLHLAGKRILWTKTNFCYFRKFI